MSGAAAAAGPRAGARAWPVGAALAGAACLLACLFLAPLLSVAPNRLVAGVPATGTAALAALAWAVTGAGAAGFAVLAAPSRPAAWAALGLLVAAILAFLAGLGSGAAELIAGHPPAARARLAVGAWAVLLLLGGAVAHAVGRTGRPGAGWLVLGALLAGGVALGRLGALDGLSLTVEYRARSAALHAAILSHLGLSAAAVALACSGAAALAPWARVRGLVDLVAGGVQVVPAVALLGVLVAATSGLLAALPALRGWGVSALGPGPAVVGVAAYLLLPLWRGLHAGLDAPDSATLEAARALGLTRWQVVARVRLPIGAPILIGALRVACVQAIGLATLGALIGAGGLGAIVFDGMAQFAPDLILLGAIPIVAASLGIDRALSRIEDTARRRWRP